MSWWICSFSAVIEIVKKRLFGVVVTKMKQEYIKYINKKFKYHLEKNEVFKTYLIKKEGILHLPSNLQNHKKGLR